jgi:biopolymer transport protein ExbB/TolQ
MLQCVMQESARRTNATILLAALMPPSWTSWCLKMALFMFLRKKTWLFKFFVYDQSILY